jgi:alkylation response protein AidB-like acyl-CoA dehydrogenase
MHTQPTRDSFGLELFQGQLRPELFPPYPLAPGAEAEEFLGRLAGVLRAHVDPDAIDRDGEIPDEAIEALAGIGAFGIKIPREHGGLGLSQLDYCRAIGLLASHCSNTTVLLGAHQSIGVPQPLKLFGSPEQQARYFPRLASGALSGFALTEAEAGSDPAAMTTTAALSADGRHWVLNGEKLWCTNGTRAELLVVIARTPDRQIKGQARKQHTAFIVETAWPGVEVTQRCHFMGLRALYAGIVRFRDVQVPVQNVLGEVGSGLKLALTTLNAGRLTVPSAAMGSAKWCLRVARRFAAERQQWGKPIGQHEAVAHKLAWIAAHAFALEAMVTTTAALVDAGDADVRVEAALCKLYASEVLWRIVNETMQIRSGAGYETAASLQARGQEPIGVERLLRDARINMIFEGTSEIMRLFLAREALGPHLARLKTLAKAPARERLGAGLHYATWYPGTWAPRLGGFAVDARLAPELEWAAAASRHLARTLVHAMLRHGQKLAERQGLLGRCVEIGAELYAVTAAVVRADAVLRAGGPEADKALRMATLFSGYARRRAEETFRALGDNQDAQALALAHDLLAGEHAWLEHGSVASEG